MKRPLLFFILITTHSLATTANAEQGSEYRNWCKRHALAEKIADEAQDDYIKACINRILDADKRPSKSPEDETDNRSSDN